MKVIIRLYATLIKYINEDILIEHPEGIRSGTPIEVQIPTSSTLGDLVTRLSLPEDMVKITFVNGVHQELKYQLQPGDQVAIFPPIAGG